MTKAQAHRKEIRCKRHHDTETLHQCCSACQGRKPETLKFDEEVLRLEDALRRAL